jgi:hypothetical protein
MDKRKYAYAIQSSGSGQPPIMTVNIAEFETEAEAVTTLNKLFKSSPVRKSYLSVVKK